MKTPFNTPNITTLISKSTEVVGDIHFSGTLEIEGKVKGNIFADDESAAEVRIREHGIVQGEITAPSIVINGFVEGDVYSSHHVELAAKSTVVGNVYYNLIEMVMGSEVNGSLHHRGESKQPRRLGVDKPEQTRSETTVAILD